MVAQVPAFNHSSLSCSFRPSCWMSSVDTTSMGEPAEKNAKVSAPAAASEPTMSEVEQIMTLLKSKSISLT